MSVKQRGTKRSVESSKTNPVSKKAKLEESSDDASSESESESESGSESDSQTDDSESEEESEEESEDELDNIENDVKEDTEVSNNKTNEQTDAEYTGDSNENKQTSKEKHEEQKKLLAERKLKRKSGIEVQRIKRLWERLRVKNPPMPKEVRDKLCDEIWSLCEGVIGDLVLKHDASRVVQTLVKYCSKERRDAICLALKSNYYNLATSAYGNSES
ncbi:unnamed protein product [Ambrosiozyma monospora]|uniref:Unnamed protein product n=1 Tax=Ambrosiozyma monospora TaxID=43982 RepID=A0ACB5SUQ5_AMBMO|nr:unnamed protein product [Ambrosiozyma monospora]